jgi:hypothetical protein
MTSIVTTLVFAIGVDRHGFAMVAPVHECNNSAGRMLCPDQRPLATIDRLNACPFPLRDLVFIL